MVSVTLESSQLIRSIRSIRSVLRPNSMKLKSLIALVLVVFCLSSFAEEIPTRFGVLRIIDENMLLFKNRPVQPAVEGKKSLSVVGSYRIKDGDAVLLQANGGTACPATFYYLTVSAADVAPKGPFGTCGDLVKVKASGEEVSVTIPGFTRPGRSKSAQRKAASQSDVFVVCAGALTEYGKPVL